MTDDPREPPVCFRPGALAGALDERGDNRNAIAKRDLERYYEIVANDLDGLRFTEKECAALTGAPGCTQANYLWADVSESAKAGLGPDFGPAFATRILLMTTSQQWAIIDALERFHALPDDTDNKLQAVGLLR